MAISQLPVQTPETTDRSGSSFACRVILFNCDCHSFDEVETQLIKAAGCTLSRARALSWEVHSKGSAVVYNGVLERCEAVAAALEDIRLKVKVLR